MVTRPLRSNDRHFLKQLGKKLEAIILEDRGFTSLDAFCLEHHEVIAKPTLYAICRGDRDMKLSTLRGIALALEVQVSELLVGF